MMNLLQAIQEKTPWGGRRDDTDETAEVRILTEAPNVNISAVGKFTKAAQVRLACTICRALRSEPRNLILNLASSSGEEAGLKYLLPAIALAKQRCNVLAKIDTACGPALFAALSCQLVFAESTAAIGHVGYWFAGVDSADVPGLAGVDVLVKYALAQLCPGVALSTWDKIMHGAVNGEQAEALGVVGGLRNGLLME